MAKHSGSYSSKKRQKELARLEKQKEKRERRLRPKVQEDGAELEGTEGQEMAPESTEEPGKTPSSTEGQEKTEEN